MEKTLFRIFLMVLFPLIPMLALGIALWSGLVVFFSEVGDAYASWPAAFARGAKH